jgi:outer membrane protein TolC
MALRREGVVTAVDEHLALARMSELEAGRANVAAERLAATDRLLALLGEEPGSPVELIEPLGLAGELAVAESADRLDVAGLEASVRASDANVDRVRAAWLPTVGAFGTLAWNQTNFGALAGPRRWTAGVMVRWNVFRGFADVADLSRARAERRAAVDRLEAARRGAAAEVRAAAARVDAARIAVEASGRALEHAAEAVRVAEARYAGGVTTITELLAVRAAEVAQRLNRLEALYHTRLARAALTLALGGTPE